MSAHKHESWSVASSMSGIKPGADWHFDGFEVHSLIITSSNSIQDFKNENMTQIAAHDETTYGFKADFLLTQGHDWRDVVRAGVRQDKLPPPPPKKTVK